MKDIPIAIPSVSDEEINAITETVKSGWITQGKRVAEFENLFSELHNVKYSLATTSCTTALHGFMCYWYSRR